MTFPARIQDLADRYLSEIRSPNIVGFVDELFAVLVDAESVTCHLNGESKLCFSTRSESPTESTARISVIVEHPAARSILRMMCARLGVVSQGDSLYTPYAGSGPTPNRRWHVAFTNTPLNPGFCIEPLRV